VFDFLRAEAASRKKRHLNAPFLSPIVPKFFARFLTGDRGRGGSSRLLGRVEAMDSRSQIFLQKGGFCSTVLPVQPKLKQNDAEFTLAYIPQFAARLTPLRTHDSIPDQYFGRGGFNHAPSSVRGWPFRLARGSKASPSMTPSGAAWVSGVRVTPSRSSRLVHGRGRKTRSPSTCPSRFIATPRAERAGNHAGRAWRRRGVCGFLDPNRFHASFLTKAGWHSVFIRKGFGMV